MQDAADALQRFRERAAVAGEPDVHINIIVKNEPVLEADRFVDDHFAIIMELRAASVTSYVWIHHHRPGIDGFPRGSYSSAFAANAEAWDGYRRALDIPYFPNVTVGWDSSPRACQSDFFEERGYPWIAVLEGSTPAAFQDALNLDPWMVRGWVGGSERGSAFRAWRIGSVEFLICPVHRRH